MEVQSEARQGGEPVVEAPQIEKARSQSALPRVAASKRGPIIIPKGVFLNESYKTLIVEYAASGANPKQIAEQLCLPLKRIQQTLEEPKIQARIHAKIAAGPLPRIQEFLAKEIVQNFLFLRETRENKKAPVRERIQAALKLIEYTVGPAKQPIFNDAKDFKNLTLEQIASLVASSPEAESKGITPN